MFCSQLIVYDDILELFRFLINNIYVKFRGNVYRQVVGIPMGCDCAPQVADLFLYWYEYYYITKGVDSKNHVIHFLKYASRYIDDLNIPNNKLINQKFNRNLLYSCLNKNFNS